MASKKVSNAQSSSSVSKYSLQYLVIDFQRRFRSSFLGCNLFTLQDPVGVTLVQIAIVTPDIIAEAVEGWYTGANSKHQVANAEISAQRQLRKRCVEQRIRLPKYFECQICIINCHPADPRNHCIEDSTIDIEEINEATYKEEEDRKMEIFDFLACSPDSVGPRISLGEECTHPHSFG
jgi:hypothetical protein